MPDTPESIPRRSHGSRRRSALGVTRAQHHAFPRRDLHPHNFCFADGRITAFDFDNCEYAWFVKDIAVIVFYVARFEARGQREDAVAAFLAPFLDGYRELRRCDRVWLEAIPDMLALQRSMNYALFHQYRDPGLLDEDTLDRWSHFRRDIEAETPVIELDFARF